MLNKLCVGAGSRRIVEEAAHLGVLQIVASRRQVNAQGGYTGITSRELVEIVRGRAGRATQVVRDHGGPRQGGFDDDGVMAFDDDVAAGFNALHIDVSLLDKVAQVGALTRLVQRYAPSVDIEVGGEHDTQEWLDILVRHVRRLDVLPRYAVADVGGYVWADRQSGNLRTPDEVALIAATYHRRGVKIKAHNMDWLGRRRRYFPVLDAYNVAPEYGLVETDALLHVLKTHIADALLEHAYQSWAWERWFDPNASEGTWDDRARCAVRYVMNDPFARELIRLDNEAEGYVRGRIRDALLQG